MSSVPPIAKATIQAAATNAGSNVLAQGIRAVRDGKPFILDLQTLLQFTTCALIVSPLTFLWLEGLESYLPGNSEEKDASRASGSTSKARSSKGKKPRLDVKNTVAKIVIDQTLGGVWNTVLFIATMGALRGQDYEVILEQVRDDFWPILMAGFKLWPLVSVLNFTIVPTEKRLLVGSLFGVGWAVYLSLMSG